MQLDQVFFYLLLAFLPTQLGYHAWPEWSMVLGRRVDYLSPTMYLTDVLIFFLLIFWIKKLFSKFQIINFKLLIKKRNCQFLISNVKKIGIFLSILLFIFANIYFAVSPWVAISKWVKVLEFGFLWLYIIKTKPKFSDIIFFLSIGVFYSSLIAIGQFLLQHSIGGPLWFLGERTFSNSTPGIAQFNWCWSPTRCQLFLRAYGPFPHPNVLGGHLAATLLVIIQYSNNQINKLSNVKKYYYVFTTVFGCIALVFSFSRSAWIIFGLWIMYYLLRKKYKNKLLSKIHISSAVVLFTSFVIIILGTLTWQDESVVVREQLNVSAIQMFFHSPLVGVGLGNYLVNLPRYLVSRQIYFFQPVHNIYLLVLSETGITGFFLCVYFIIHALKKYKTNTLNIKKQTEQRDGKKFFHNSLFIVLFLGLVDHYPLTLQQGQLLFTILLAASTIAS